MDAMVSPRRRTLLKAAAGSLALATAGCYEMRFPGSGVAPVQRFGGPAMGSTYTVKVAGAALPGAELAAVHAAVREALGAVESAMSAFLPDSELSRFNRHASPQPFAFSPGTLAVFATAGEVSAATSGAFDVTVAPLVDAWGFGPQGQRAIPAEETLAGLAGVVDYRTLRLDLAAGTVAKARPDARADFSGVAKGYAVDRAAAALEAMGLRDFMVEAGGEVRTRGTNGEGRPWRIAIEKPDAVPREPWFVVPMTDLSLATSGDYRIFFEHEGVRYSHEIDPATRRPARHALASVSVVAANCAYADAMATALFVLGPQRGLELAEDLRLAAYFIEREAGGGFAARASTGFGRLGGMPYAQG